MYIIANVILFLNKTAHLDNYEYEIVETKTFCFKIWTWNQPVESASNVCNTERARLLTIHNQDEMTIVQDKIRNNLIMCEY